MDNVSWSGAFVLDQNQNLVFLAPSLTVFYNRKSCASIGYPGGSLGAGDTVVYIHRGLRQDNREQSGQVLAAMGIDMPLGEARWLAAICAYPNRNSQPLFKSGGDDPLFLDTVYREIPVAVRDEGGGLTIRVGQARFRMEPGPCDDFFIVVGQGDIKYFSDGHQASRKIPFPQLLEGVPYPGYSLVELPFVEGVPAAELLDRDFLAGCRPDQPEPAVFTWQGAELWVEKERLHHRDGTFTLCRVEDRAGAARCVDHGRDVLEALESQHRRSQMVNQVFTAVKILGSDSRMNHIRYLLNKVAPTSTGVLLTGESGTGKTFMAREIHSASPHRAGPFIHVNCASIPYSLIESELFGYVEGAFTGARRGGKKGFFELAKGGTIFLDEVGELPLELQGRLLEVIQNRTFYQVGGSEKVSVNARVIAATNQDLARLVSEKKFREDLYYRINVFSIELPPLRERREDIAIIAQNLLPRICERTGREPLQWSGTALAKLKGHHWPGNIRELENIIEKATILCEGKVLMDEDIVLDLSPDPKPVKTLKNSMEDYEKALIEAALQQAGGSRSQAAKLLDIGRTTLFEKMHKYHIT